MPLPKRRHSHGRSARRRTHYKLVAVTVAKDRCPGNNPDCPGTHVSHAACPVCGYYKGRQVFVPKTRRNRE